MRLGPSWCDSTVKALNHWDLLRDQRQSEWPLSFCLPLSSLIQLEQCKTREQGQLGGGNNCVLCDEFVLISLIEDSVVKVHSVVESKYEVTRKLPKKMLVALSTHRLVEFCLETQLTVIFMLVIWNCLSCHFKGLKLLMSDSQKVIGSGTYFQFNNWIN